MSYKSKEYLNSLAKTAADLFVNKKTPMNDTLKKVASSEGLQPHHVEYIAGEANKMVWAREYKLNKTAAYDFPIADPNVIVGDMQKKPIEKVAEVNLDYMSSPSELKKVASTDGEAFGVFESEVTKDQDRKQLKQTLTARYEKLAQARKDGELDLLSLESKVMHLEEKFVKEARVLIIETPFTERAQAMEKIAEFVRSAGHFEVGKRLMEKLSKAIVSSGLIKQADLQAPEQYISESLPARIINGNHSLYITIDTIVKHQDRISSLKNNFIICDDTLPVLKEKIRGL
jgi:hypothetical protein